MSSSISGELHAQFQQGDPAYSPVPIWWWSGEALDLERMRWQVDQLVSQGVYNAVVLNLAPTGPIHGALSDWPHMGSDAWWEIWSELCAHSTKVGMRLWFYDQIGFSGANIQGRLAVANPSFVGMSIDRVHVDIAGEGEVACPQAGTAIAAFALPLDAGGKDAGDPIQLEIRNGVARWCGTGRARLMLAYAIRKGFDYHSPEACAALIDTVHGEFERRLGDYFGTAIVGSFQDELPSVPSWSDRFEHEFEGRTGYAIGPKLAALWEDWGIESARVRVDYQRVRAALAEAAFFKPLFDWHDSRGLTFGVDQQSPARAAEPLGATDQYADYARTHRWYSAPGSDHWGDAKFHSSLAHSYGRPRTWIESFHSSGWGGTLEETFDWLQPWLLAGANLYDPHAVYYSTKGGQWEWAAPSTCWRQPYWRHYKHFADTISRLCWAATRGEHVCDIGVLYPSAAVQADMFLDAAGEKGRAAHRAYMELTGSMIWFNTRKGVLGRLHRDYDVLDDDTVAGSTIEPGSLATRAERYRAVIVPHAWMLEAKTLAKLIELARAGGVVIVVGGLPEVTDRADAGHLLGELQQLIEQGRVKVLSAGETLEHDLAAALAPLPPLVVADRPTLLRRAGELNLLFVTAAPEGQATKQPMLPWAIWDYDNDIFPMARYNSELREKGYDFDAGRNGATTTVRIAGKVGAIEQWDPATGKARRVRVTERSGSTEVTVDFADCPMSILVWMEHGESTAELAGAPPGAVVTLPAVWRSSLVPTIDNRYGDFTLPAAPGPLPVEAWIVEHREDASARPDPSWTEHSWTRLPVTQGLRAWQYGPSAPATLPAPLAKATKLAGEGWSPVHYSLSRGIDHDVVHDRTLGPKGRVPEEFWRCRKVKTGDAVQFRTTLPAAAGTLTLAIGGNGIKTVWWNGELLPEDPGGYLYMTSVPTKGDDNLLELRIETVADDDLAGYWALTNDGEAFERPEWLQPADGGEAGSSLVMSRTIDIAVGDDFEAQFASQGVATLLVNGRDVGMHGGFDPYAGWQAIRIIKYRLTDYLKPGPNRIEVRFTDIGKPMSMLFDGVITASGRNSSRTIVSDMRWQAHRDGRPVPISLQRGQRNDPRYALIRPRPHPLPRTGWLDPEQPISGVLDLVPEPRPGAPKLYQWFRVPLPPGTSSMRLPAKGVELAVFNDGEEHPVIDGHVALSPRNGRSRSVLVRARATDGRSGGAIWDGPISFEIGSGIIDLGPWSEAGLEFYSGGVAYEQTISIERPEAFRTLDLGQVRGTAEVEINGVAAGVRVWSPYRFDIAGLLRAGENTITVRVFNTLAPYLKGASPTRTIFLGQDVSGMMGPVRLS